MIRFGQPADRKVKRYLPNLSLDLPYCLGEKIGGKNWGEKLGDKTGKSLRQSRMGYIVFEGIYTALVTPFRAGGVDVSTLGRLIDRQLEAGVQGLVLCATTGEGLTLTDSERKLVIDTAVKRVGDRAKVIAGCSAVATWQVIEHTKIAAELGVSGMLVPPPSYVKPSQDGMYAHFDELANHSSLPIVLYNVPSRTACDMLPSTVARLAVHENIVAIKEASGSVERAQQIIAAVSGKLGVLCGDDPATLSTLVAGGRGVISTGANVVPEKWVSLWKRWQTGDVMSAAAVQAGLLGLHEALFMEPNPGPVKVALYLLGQCEPEIRLPLIWPARPTVYRIAAELERLGVRIESGSLV